METYTLNGKEIDKPFRSFFLDGSSFLQSEIKQKCEDENREAGLWLVEDKKTKTKKFKRDLIDRFRTDISSWGAIGSTMKRITAQLNRISQMGGVTVVMTAWDDPDAIVKRPLFLGKDFPRVVAGYFDFIGLVETRYNNKNEIVYPPLVDFVPSRDKLAKCCDTKLAEKLRTKGPMPLDFQVIMNNMGSKAGSCFLLYSDFGVGKTYSASTLDDPIAMCVAEPRDPRRVLGEFADKKQIKFWVPSDFDEIMEMLDEWGDLVQKG
jgi:hypothetical protein